MMLPLLILAVAASAAAAPVPHGAPHPPPSPQAPPSPAEFRDQSAEPEAIFTYAVDGQCRVTDTRKLQGADDVRWEDAEAARQVAAEDTVFRFVDGVRTRLRERRVKLLGEMIRSGELVCHVKPTGGVVEAWIERQDAGAARRRSVEREAVAVTGGRIPDLGTFSLVMP